MRKAKHPASDLDAHQVEQLLVEQGVDHLRVRRYGDLLTLSSGPKDDPVRHARLRHVTVQYWTLEMATHMGRFQPTGLRGLLDDVLDALVHDFGWTLTPID